MEPPTDSKDPSGEGLQPEDRAHGFDLLDRLANEPETAGIELQDDAYDRDPRDRVRAADLPPQRQAMRPAVAAKLASKLASEKVVCLASHRPAHLHTAAAQIAQASDLEVHRLSRSQERGFESLFRRVHEGAERSLTILDIAEKGQVDDLETGLRTFSAWRDESSAHYLVLIDAEDLEGKQRLGRKSFPVHTLDDASIAVFDAAGDWDEAEDVIQSLSSLPADGSGTGDPEAPLLQVENLLEGGGLEGVRNFLAEQSDPGSPSPSPGLAVPLTGPVEQAVACTLAYYPGLPYDEFDRVIRRLVQGRYQPLQQKTKPLPTPRAETEEQEPSPAPQVSATEHWDSPGVAQEAIRSLGAHVATDPTGVRVVAFPMSRSARSVRLALDDASALQTARLLFSKQVLFHQEVSDSLASRLLGGFGTLQRSYPSALDSTWIRETLSSIRSRSRGGSFQGADQRRFGRLLCHILRTGDPAGLVERLLTGLLGNPESDPGHRQLLLDLVRVLRWEESFPYFTWLQRILDSGGKELHTSVHRLVLQETTDGPVRLSELLVAIDQWLPAPDTPRGRYSPTESIAVELPWGWYLATKAWWQGLRSQGESPVEPLYEEDPSAPMPLLQRVELLGRILFHPGSLAKLSELLWPVTDRHTLARILPTAWERRIDRREALALFAAAQMMEGWCERAPDDGRQTTFVEGVLVHASETQRMVLARAFRLRFEDYGRQLAVLLKRPNPQIPRSPRDVKEPALLGPSTSREWARRRRSIAKALRNRCSRDPAST